MLSRPKSKRKTKASYHHGDLRNTLIAKALNLIEQRRDVSFTLREIAARAGVSHAAAYRHFSDKRQLLSVLAEEGFRLLAGEFAAALRSTPGQNRVDQLRQLGLAYVSFAMKHPGHFRAMFHSELADRGPFPALQQAAKEAFNPLRATIEAGIKEGVFRDAAVDTASIAAWSLVHGFSMLALDQHVTFTEKNHPTSDQMASAIVTLFQEGISKQ